MGAFCRLYARDPTPSKFFSVLHRVHSSLVPTRQHCLQAGRAPGGRASSGSSSAARLGLEQGKDHQVILPSVCKDVKILDAISFTQLPVLRQVKQRLPLPQPSTPLLENCWFVGGGATYLETPMEFRFGFDGNDLFSYEGF